MKLESAKVKILPIELKLFEEEFRPAGRANKSVMLEGVESEFWITSEMTCFGKHLIVVINRARLSIS